MKALRKLAARLDVSVHWLEFGEPDPAEELARMVLEHDSGRLPERVRALARTVLGERPRT